MSAAPAVAESPSASARSSSSSVVDNESHSSADSLGSIVNSRQGGPMDEPLRLAEEYVRFLRDIGYLAPSVETFSITTA